MASTPARDTSSASSTGPPISSTLRLAWARGRTVGSSVGVASASGRLGATRSPRRCCRGFARSTPRTPRRDSIACSPVARAYSMACSANGIDSLARPRQHQVRGQARQHPGAVDGRAVLPAAQRPPRAARSRSRCRRPDRPRSRIALAGPCPSLPADLIRARGGIDDVNRAARQVELPGIRRRRRLPPRSPRRTDRRGRDRSVAPRPVR